ncbi:MULTISPECIES: HNH endonuclease [Arcicella]|uniref:HNH endonuclease n=1 Tax=Arcicella aquatica TaxID=217141 RepID=A0ABU5QSJ4_9BACT|nr:MULTISPECIES: HNH endonuclease [Arcicella]MDR6563159.1 DNA-binding Xre family transcriptional regulator [Arcicella sp. BE51]MDR6811690.1 DNA-binding Xre family transcriptional regulator [Arcicella sp. BE140]MDR6823215.1 DNA-binding Xre family transcriptional regulator [Arcicella sp. BE139]MEA5259968.1 HNH endonuclease [Arcicella aquatica]
MIDKKTNLGPKKSASFWNEKWVDIPFQEVENPPVYKVSNYGRLKSFQNDPVQGDIINGSKIQGYKSLNIRAKGNKSLNRYVHKLVAEFFVEKQNEEQKFVIHLDHDKLNNYWENLKWVTRDEMTIHNRENPAVKDRVIPKRTKNYKLTESKVIMIKKMLRSDKNRLKMIAKQFGITHTQLNRIRSGENWGHVKLED